MSMGADGRLREADLHWQYSSSIGLVLCAQGSRTFSTQTEIALSLPSSLTPSLYQPYRKREKNRLLWHD